MTLKERMINFIIKLFEWYDPLSKLEKYTLLVSISIILGLFFSLFATIIPYPFPDGCNGNYFRNDSVCLP